jgi:pilus assembly protein CpaE
LIAVARGARAMDRAQRIGEAGLAKAERPVTDLQPGVTNDHPLRGENPREAVTESRLNHDGIAVALHRGVIIAFLGTKGGTGTTTMAVNGAAEIHRLSRRATIVVDAKPGPGDVAVLLGLHPRYSLIELIDQLGWSDQTQAVRYVTEHESGLHVLAASEGFGRPSSRDVEGVEQSLACISSMYEFVIVDAGNTLSSSAIAALTHADIVVLVANPDLPCLRNLQRLTDALRLAGVVPERVRVLLNRASDHGVPASQMERMLGRTIDFSVPSDYGTVAAAVNAGVPVCRLRQTDLQRHLEVMSRALVGLEPATAAS